MLIKPFRGARPRADLVSKIPSYPYDILDSQQARALAEGDPYTFLHVEKPEIDLEPEVNPHDERVYAKGRENLRAMLDQGWLVQDGRPAYYVYRLTSASHTQTGIAGVAALDDYEADRIKKHEHTRPDKENDRTRHIDVLGAQSGPILMAYRAIPELNALVTGLTTRAPDADFHAPDGVEHALWIVDDPATCGQIESLFAKVPATYIADGHHRAAAAERVRRLRRERTPKPAAEALSDSLFAVHFPSSQLRILGYHRLVRDLNGLDPAGLLDRIRKAGFEVTEQHREKHPPRPRSFGMFLPGKDWRLVEPGPGWVPPKDPVKGLDVSILSETILGPVLGIGDPRTDRRIEFVGGENGIEDIERRVRAGEHAVAFALYPPAMDDVIKVADSGRVMPPKSTWFEPKLRSGMVVHLLD